MDPNITLVITPAMPVFTYFRTSGNQIMDRMGNAVRFTAVNWSATPPARPCLPLPHHYHTNTITNTRLGFETASFIPQGLWTRNYQQLLSQMRTLGFNSVRISFCQQALREASGQSRHHPAAAL